jgi:hypothetical protein
MNKGWRGRHGTSQNLNPKRRRERMCARTTDEQEKIESSADIFGEHAQRTIAEALSARRQFVEMRLELASP